MFKWLWRRLGLAGRIASKYDVVYGLPKSAVDEWPQWNPQLEAEHKALDRLAQKRRDEAAGNKTIAECQGEMKRRAGRARAVVGHEINAHFAWSECG